MNNGVACKMKNNLFSKRVVVSIHLHHFLFDPYNFPNNKTRQNNCILPAPVKSIHPSSAKIQSRMFWQKSLTTETDANIWQPFADHPVRDTFLDSQLHRASRCSSPSPDDVGRLKPVVFDDDRMRQPRSE